MHAHFPIPSAAAESKKKNPKAARSRASSIPFTSPIRAQAGGHLALFSPTLLDRLRTTLSHYRD